MIKGQLDIDYQSHTNPKPDRRRRGHSNQFEIRHTNSDVYANSYFPRTVKTWNNLQQATINQTSPLSFKNAVTKELLPKCNRPPSTTSSQNSSSEYLGGKESKI